MFRIRAPYEKRGPGQMTYAPEKSGSSDSWLAAMGRVIPPELHADVTRLRRLSGMMLTGYSVRS